MATVSVKGDVRGRMITEAILVIRVMSRMTSNSRSKARLPLICQFSSQTVPS